jgi:hypothetical protein
MVSARSRIGQRRLRLETPRTNNVGSIVSTTAAFESALSGTCRSNAVNTADIDRDVAERFLAHQRTHRADLVGCWTVALAPDDRRPIAALLVVPPPAIPVEQDGSGPRVVRIPFDPVGFVSVSAPTDDDPLVDRDAVRRAVMDAAEATYGADRVSGGDPVLLRIPRIPGFLVGCHVTVNGEDIFYTAVVTDKDNEFIVYECPPEGLQFIGPD